MRAPERCCGYELNGQVGLVESPVLMVAISLPLEVPVSDCAPLEPAGITMRVRLLPTRLWFLNRLRTVVDKREARVLRYDAIKDSWQVVARRKW